VFMKNNYKVIYIDYNFGNAPYPQSMDIGDGFYTYGFGGTYSREFKKYNPDIEVECWKAEHNVTKIHTRTIENVKYILFPATRIPKFGNLSLSLKKHLKREIKKSTKIVFNISSCRHLLFHSIAPLLKNNPLIVQGHGETTIIADLKHRKGILSKLRAIANIIFEQRAFANVDIYNALNPDYKYDLPKTFHGQMHVQGTGVNPSIHYPINKIEARNKLDLDVTKKYILFIGRLDQQKRVDILINAYNELKDDYPDWQLILGGTSSGEEFEKLAIDSGAIIYRTIPRPDLHIYMSASDVYVLAQYAHFLRYGGIGILPVEAMYCNIPSIGEGMKCFPEEDRQKVGIFTDNKEDLKKALIKVLEKEKSFNNIRDIAVKHYSWENISKNTRKKYDELISNYK